MTTSTPPISPLTAAHVSRVLRYIDPVLTSNLSDLYRQLLQATQTLPNIDSSYLVELDTAQNIYQQYWLGLEGELRESEVSLLSNSPWESVIHLKLPELQDIVWTTPSSEFMGLDTAEPQDILSLGTASPTTNSSQALGHRCILPLHQQKPIHWLLVLQSDTPQFFSSWQPELLTLMGQQMSVGFKNTHALHDLQHKLSFHHQRLSLMPPSLSSLLHLGQTFLNEANPVISIFQHNLDTLRTYHLKVLEALDYYRDEIRLYAAENAIQRLEGYEQRNQLADVFADLDSVLQDTSSGVFRLRYFLNFLRGLRPQPSNPEQFQLNSLLQPLLSNLFNDKRIQCSFQEFQSIPLYGDPYRVQLALIELLMSIPRSIDPHASAPQVEIETGEENGEVFFAIAYPVASLSVLEQVANEEGYLFVKQVMEEHQGSFVVTTEDLRLTLSLYLPIMFEDTYLEGSMDPHTPHSFSVVGPLEFPALESTDSLQELPTHTRTKLLFFSSDSLFSRALKRVLSRHIDFLSASTLAEARDQVSVHSDLSLILCDLEESAEDSFSLLDEMQTYHPGLAPYVCFLVGESPPLAIVDFAKRIHPRCCDRHSSIETLQRFIHRRRRV